MSDTAHPTGESTESVAEEPTAEQSTAASSEPSDSVPVASLLPWRSSGTEADLTITVYIVTGKHGKLRIPESFCRECNLFVRAADIAAEQVDSDVEVRVVSWWTHVFSALRYGGYHAPVMVVGNRRLCQGYDVPTTAEVLEAIEAALGRQ
jgi:hypothetical protein